LHEYGCFNKTIVLYRKTMPHPEASAKASRLPSGPPDSLNTVQKTHVFGSIESHAIELEPRCEHLDKELMASTTSRVAATHHLPNPHLL
jgi:hypothetical protein